jgi:hypothetical protein
MASISSAQTTSSMVLLDQNRVTRFPALMFRKCLSTLRNGVMPTPPAIMTMEGFASMPLQNTPRGPMHFTGVPGLRSGMADVNCPIFLMVNRSCASSGAHEMVNGWGSLHPSGRMILRVAYWPAFLERNLSSAPSSKSELIS